MAGDPTSKIVSMYLSKVFLMLKSNSNNVRRSNKSGRAKTRTLLLELGVENFILNSVLAKVM
jgi:hypothetical protein